MSHLTHQLAHAPSAPAGTSKSTMTEKIPGAVPVRTKTNFNYGVHGWLLLFYGMINFMTAGAFWTAAAQNTAVAEFAVRIGASSATLLYWCTVAGVAATIMMLFVGMLFDKFGTHIMGTAALLLTGICIIIYGHINTLPAYVICFFAIFMFSSATSSFGVPQIFTSYFPTKKGSIMGWASCGSSLASLVSLGALTWLMSKGGWELGTLVFGIFTIIMGLINWFLIPDMPEQMGVLPDNGDFDEAEMQRRQAIIDSPTPVWTLKEGLMNKNFWLLSIAYGLLFLVNIGTVSQLVSFELSMGLSQSQALMYMSIMPLFAIPGSIVTGWLDQKIGARRTGIILAAFYAIGTLFGGFVPYSTATNWIFYVFTFFLVGGMSNLPQSHTCSVYGGRDYPKLWGYINPIISLIRVCNTAILAFALSSLNGYRDAYKIFMVCSIIAGVLLFFSDNNVIKDPGEKPTGVIK